MPPRSPARLLDDLLPAEGGRPFLTWYDDTTGQRLELSVATFANWVAKTAGLLVYGLGTAPGDLVRVAAPADHWQSLVWAVATWRAGCVVDPYDRTDGGPTAAVAVTGPDGRTAGPADDVLALSLRPLGAPFTEGALPPGALDFAREVPAYPDRYGGPYAAPGDPAALDRTGAVVGGADLADLADALAGRWGAGPGARLLLPSGGGRPADPLDLLLAGTLVALVTRGSVVVCAGPGPVPVGRAEQEQVTAVAGNP